MAFQRVVLGVAYENKSIHTDYQQKNIQVTDEVILTKAFTGQDLGVLLLMLRVYGTFVEPLCLVYCFQSVAWLNSCLVSRIIVLYQTVIVHCIRFLLRSCLPVPGLYWCEDRTT